MSLQMLLTEEEIAGIRDAPLYADERHPAWSTLFQEQASAVDFLTREAAGLIAHSVLRERLRSTAARAADLHNISDAAAALAELRACGAMMVAGLDPRPIRAKGKRGATPDFEADAGDGKVLVEVHAKHEDGEQTKRRALIAEGHDVPGVERNTIRGKNNTITFITSVHHPGGIPDSSNPFDSIQSNVISKLCRAKSDERQLSLGAPSVLWLDLSYFGRMTETLLEQTHPLVSGHIGLTSGAIWYAYYGWKGAPILEEGNRQKVLMGHDGRFQQTRNKTSNFSAVIVTFEKGLVLFENPWAILRLPKLFRRKCERLPWFKISHSVADWSTGEAEGLVAFGRARIEALGGNNLN